jgi:coenzyme F420-reducing hydrogenase alpha subunit
MVDEGTLFLKLVMEEGKVARVALTSTRRTDFSTVLTGLKVEKALGLVPSLFSICASAQAVAGLEACEAALGLEADEGNRALRRALAALEAIDNHAFQFFVEWPRVVGCPPEVAVFRKVRGACQAARSSLVGPASWARLGGVEVSGGADAAGLRAAVEAAIPKPRARAHDEGALAVWSPFLAAALGAGAREVGQGSAVPLLPLEDAAWFGRRLQREAGFSAAPTVDGVPAEAGSLAFVASEAPVEALLASGGRTVWARLVAQLANVHRLVGVVESAVERARGGCPVAAAEPGAGAVGAGAGIADTSRGRLAHAVETSGGVITSWRTVAPTEWSFHPEGAAAMVLTGLTAEAASAVAPFLVASLDPCVACRVSAGD